MRINSVCVLGGAGFVGRRLCEQLAARGYRLRVPTRSRERAKPLTVLPTAEVVEADVHRPDALSRVVQGSDAVINLVGVLHDGRGPASFRQAHVALARNVVEACRAQGVRRLLHMSAINAGRGGPSAYLRSKGEAEAIVRESALEWTVFQPSVIFGREDRFLNVFAALQKVFPVVPLACPGARFQPVYVEDVAAAFVAALVDPGAVRQTYPLCGPRVYTLRELVRYAGAASGHPRPIIGLGPRLSYLQALAMEWSPGKLMSRDNYYSMQVDAVCDCGFPFGLKPQAIEALADAWLGGKTRSARIQQLREHVRD